MSARSQSPVQAAVLSFARCCLLGSLFFPPFSLFSNAAHAENVTRSEPQTPGEKRLLEWDLNKSYDLSRSRTNPKGASASRPFATQSFGAKEFNTKVFSAQTFTSPEFLTPESKTRAKPFALKSAPASASSSFGKSFSLENFASTPPKALPTGANAPSPASKRFAEGSRSYQGPEALHMERKFSPGNAPTGGVTEGRLLSAEEVKEILNKTK